MCLLHKSSEHLIISDHVCQFLRNYSCASIIFYKAHTVKSKKSITSFLISSKHNSLIFRENFPIRQLYSSNSLLYSIRAKLQRARLAGASNAVNRRRELQLLRSSVGDCYPPRTVEDGTRHRRSKMEPGAYRAGGHRRLLYARLVLVLFY